MIDLAIVAIYMIGILTLGLFTGLRVKDLRDYSVGNQQYSTFIMVAAIYATLIGGGSTMGVAEKAFSTGMVFFVMCTGFVVRDIFTAYFVVPYISRFQSAISVGDIMGTFYGKPGQVLTGIAGMLKAIALVSMQVSAIGYLLDYFLGIPHLVGTLCGTGVVIIYSAFGGIRSVTITDVVQFILLVVAIPLIFSVSMVMVGGLDGLLHTVPAKNMSFLPPTAESVRYISLFLVFMVPDMDPAVVQRLLMGKNAQQVKRALLISAFGRLPCYFFASVLGLVALVLKPDLQADLALPYLVNTLLPVGLKGLAVAGLLAVLMSSADSFLHVAGTLFTHDVINPLRKKPFTDSQELFLTKLVTFALGTLVLGWALSTTNLMELNFASYILWVPAILVPLLAGVWGVVVSGRIYVASSIAGIGTFVVWKAYGYPITHIDALLIAPLVGGFVFAGGYFWEKAKIWTPMPLPKTLRDSVLKKSSKGKSHSFKKASVF